VVSDWGSIGEMIPHGYAEDGKHASELAVNAGSDMDMESYLYVEHLAALVQEGKVDEAYINDAARRILTVKYELGLFENPYKYCDEAREKATIGKEAHQEAVLDMAKKSIVLLKNENKLLPLKKSGQRIAVIGQFANDKNSPLGSWRIAADDNTAVSLMEGMAAYPDNTLTYALGAQVSVGPTSFVMETKINEDDTSGFAEAIRVARAADVVIMNLGEVGWQSGEGRSRANIDLPGVQQELLEAVYKVNKNIVLVLQSGRPLALPWADENIPAIVQAWQLGTQSGNAIAQVLYGDYNPSGKMPMTTPRDKGQIPLYYNHKSTGRPTIPAPNLVFWQHYMDESNDPLYPFGHGLSYTEFKYDGLEVNANGDGSYKVSFTLTNSGAVKGKEVAQLYIQDVTASVTRPVRELKGFELVELEPGASKEITFNISDAELGYYNNEGEFIVEDGLFRVFVGGSSATQYSTEFAR
ncbi:glycoside hydrolase family 3 C-terminal domain-containing protein, partial [Gilvibacter sp.]|uniref:glycoside hydrolase family 3 C-terminal domain-containing protein n=1 Tax=Gilvibacter sp. TaxID=2729997 RepID=UPI0035BE3FA5